MRFASSGNSACAVPVSINCQLQFFVREGFESLQGLFRCADCLGRNKWLIEAHHQLGELMCKLNGGERGRKAYDRHVK